MKGLFRRPLARWGFTVCAAVALLTRQTIPRLVAGGLAAYAWHCTPTRRR